MTSAFGRLPLIFDPTFFSHRIKNKNLKIEILSFWKN